MKKPEALWFVYVLECMNGRLYTGITTNLDERFAKHCSGKGAMFTRLNRPSRMIGAISFLNRSEASRLEWTIKQLTPECKRETALGWPTKRLPKIVRRKL